MLTPVTYRVVGESHIVLSLDTGRVYGPDLVIILTERSFPCASRDGIRRCRKQVHRHRGRSRRPSGILDVNAGLMLSVRSYPLPPPCPVLGLWAQAGMIYGDSSPIDVPESSGPSRHVYRPDRAVSRCGPPVRPPAHAIQVMGLMINRFAVL